MGSAAKRLVLDTGLLIHYLRGASPGREATKAATRQFDCCITAITVYEIVYGVERTGRDIGEDALLNMFAVLPFDETAARRAAQIKNTLFRRNEQIGTQDTLIAATCLVHNLPLLTLNARHFERVPGLIVLKPEDLPPPPG